MARPSAVSSNCVEMGGKKRSVDFIRLEDFPRYADGELRRIAEEDAKGRPMRMVAIVVAVASALFIACNVYLLILGTLSPFLETAAIAMKGVALFGFSGPLLWVGLSCQKRNRYALRLKRCREDLQMRSFRSFVQKEGQAFSPEQWLRLHRSYESEKKRKQKMNELIDALHSRYC